MKKKKYPIANCWICKDQGLIIYEMPYGKTSYEVACRCSCKKGLDTSQLVPLIGDKLAKKLAVYNYNKSILT